MRPFRRVFALVPDCHVDGWRYGDVWRRHFYDGLARADVEVVFPEHVDFGWARPVHTLTHVDEGARREVSAELSRQLDRAAARGGIDAVVSYCFSHDVELDLVEQVVSSGVPWINFFCDSLYALHTVEALARRTSLNWFVETEAEGLYADLGVPYLRAPYALDPAGIPDATCVRAERPLSFVGSVNRDRIRSATILRVLGVDLHVAGWGWPEALAAPEGSGPRNLLRRAVRAGARQAFRGRVQGYLSEEDMLSYLRGSHVSLGLNRGPATAAGRPSYLKLREMEFPATGCCYLTRHNRDVETILSVGEEVHTYRSLREVKGKARALASDPELCRRTGLRARERLLSEHTWNERLSQLAAALR